MNYLNSCRPAIAMIELIFAIVIMGIVMMSAPQLISTSTQSGYVAIQQEAIAEAASHINNVLSYDWDENLPYARIANANMSDYILVASGGHANLNKIGTHYRLGTPAGSPRTFLDDTGTEYNTSTIGTDTGEVKGSEDDMDDFNGQSYNLVDLDSSSIDYIEKETEINIATEVAYISDTPTTSGYQSGTISVNLPLGSVGSTNNTNIKQINVTVTSSGGGASELNKNVILRTFSCNIGAARPDQLARKVF